jgi:type II secretory pathway pseudopilin PulG
VTAPAPHPPRTERGFGLIEIMITLVLSMLVLGVVMMTFFHSSSQAARLTLVADERQNARTAVQLLEREIRMAGSGWGRVDIFCNDSSGKADTLLAVNPGYSSVGGNDSLVLVGAWLASTALSAPMASPTSVVTVASSNGFSAGDLFILTNSSTGKAHMLMCTGVPNATTLSHATTSPYNVSDVSHLTDTWPPSGGYAATVTSVYKATVTSYYYDSTSFRKPALMRHEYGQAPQVVAYNVDGFRVWYQLQDGTWTRNPPNMSSVDKVSPVVFTKVTDPRLPTLRDSVWAAVEPRTF